MRKRRTKDDSSADSLKPEPAIPLSAEVREALRAVLHDAGAAAQAKTSAGRTLMEWFGEEQLGVAKPMSEMTMAEIDAEIARLTRARE